jgi:hypothetical protein
MHPLLPDAGVAHPLVTRQPYSSSI